MNFLISQFLFIGICRWRCPHRWCHSDPSAQEEASAGCETLCVCACACVRPSIQDVIFFSDKRWRTNLLLWQEVRIHCFYFDVFYAGEALTEVHFPWRQEEGVTETEHGPVSVTSPVRADCQCASWSKSKEEVWWDRHGYQGIYDQKPAEEAAVSAVTSDLWLYLTNVTFSHRRCTSFLRKVLVFDKFLIKVCICASLWARVQNK